MVAAFALSAMVSVAAAAMRGGDALVLCAGHALLIEEPDASAPAASPCSAGALGLALAPGAIAAPAPPSARAALAPDRRAQPTAHQPQRFRFARAPPSSS